MFGHALQSKVGYPGAHPHTAESRDDSLIELDACAIAHKTHDVVRGCIAVLACFILQEIKRCVIAALPMQYHRDLLAVLLDDDLSQNGADDAFLQLLRALRIAPESRKILT